MVKAPSDGLVGYIQTVLVGDIGLGKYLSECLMRTYGYNDCLRIIEAAIWEGETSIADVLDPAKADERRKAWTPEMRDNAYRLAGWE